MVCPLGVKTCQQVAVSGNATMRCDADECEQVCTRSICNMTCPASVKECHQICFSGKCLFKCDAEKCKVDCFGDSSCTTVKPTSRSVTDLTTARSSIRALHQMKPPVLGALLLVSLVFV